MKFLSIIYKSAPAKSRAKLVVVARAKKSRHKLLKIYCLCTNSNN